MKSPNESLIGTSRKTLPTRRARKVHKRSAPKMQSLDTSRAIVPRGEAAPRKRVLREASDRNPVKALGKKPGVA